MDKVTMKKLRYIYGLFFSVWTVLVGGLFIVQTWTLYNSTPISPYSRASVAKYFHQIAVPVWIWVAALAVHIVWALAIPSEPEKAAAIIDPQIPLRRLTKQLQSATPEMQKERRFRFTLQCICGAVSLATAGVCLWLLLDKSYNAWIETPFLLKHSAAADRMLRVCFWSIAALAVLSVAAYFAERSVRKEIALAKAALVAQVKAGVKPVAVAKTSKPTLVWWKQPINITRMALAVVGITFVVWGICNGGMNETLQKAINICTQCIGLG